MSVLWHKQTHGIPVRKAKSDRTVALLFLLIIVLVTALSAAYLGLVADNVRLSRQVWGMEQTSMAMERECQRVNVNIAQLSSIPVMQQRSVKLGFQPAPSVEHIYLKEP
jgi:hypothetical protein